MNRSPQTELVGLRVMTFNIHHGRGMDGMVDLERIAAVIRAEAPDVVGLQEVDRGVARTDRRDLPAELSRLTGMHVFFERNIPFEGGDYGNAVLSRLPVLKEANTHLRTLYDDEQRGAIHMVLDVRGERLLFVNTHIDYREDDADRLLSIDQLREIVARHGDLPTVVTGDFNDFPESRTHRRMKEHFADAWEVAGEGDGLTFRSDRPDRRIDYVFTSKTILPRRARVIESLASDHFSVVVDLELPRQPERDQGAW